MTFVVHNALTKKKEEFRTLEKGVVHVRLWPDRLRARAHRNSLVPLRGHAAALAEYRGYEVRGDAIPTSAPDGRRGRRRDKARGPGAQGRRDPGRSAAITPSSSSRTS
jgi:hypothetical protein